MKGKAVKAEELIQGPDNTKPETVVTALRKIRAAACRPQVLRFVEPGPAPQYAAAAITGGSGRPVRWRARIAVIPTILNPFPDIAVHVMEAEPVRCV